MRVEKEVGWYSYSWEKFGSELLGKGRRARGLFAFCSFFVFVLLFTLVCFLRVSAFFFFDLIINVFDHSRSCGYPDLVVCSLPLFSTGSVLHENRTHHDRPAQ